MTVYGLARRAWDRVPVGLRERVRRCGPLDALKRGVHAAVRRVFASDDDTYTERFYSTFRGTAARDADAIARHIAAEFRPRRVVDVGCGAGDLIASLQAMGVSVLGIENSRAGVALCRERGVPVRRLDVARRASARVERFDVAASLEVAEHLPEASAGGYVDFLCRCAPVVILTAAQPGQGGVNHVNEQPPDYWIGKFAARGYVLDAERTAAWREAWRGAGVSAWYHSNLMIFRSATASGTCGPFGGQGGAANGD